MQLQYVNPIHLRRDQTGLSAHLPSASSPEFFISRIPDKQMSAEALPPQSQTLLLASVCKMIAMAPTGTDRRSRPSKAVDGPFEVIDTYACLSSRTDEDGFALTFWRMCLLSHTNIHVVHSYRH